MWVFAQFERTFPVEIDFFRAQPDGIKTNLDSELESLQIDGFN